MDRVGRATQEFHLPWRDQEWDSESADDFTRCEKMIEMSMGEYDLGDLPCSFAHDIQDAFRFVPGIDDERLTAGRITHHVAIAGQRPDGEHLYVGFR